MLTISNLKLGTVITHNGQPYIVIAAQHVKQGRGGANLKAKLKNLITGQNLEMTYAGGDKIEEADLARAKANFLYAQGDEYYFMDNESYDQFNLKKEVIGESADFLKEGMEVEILVFQGNPVAVKLPIKAEFKVIEAPPAIKGDTAGNAMKLVTLETGKQIKAPLFIKQGEIIRVNTETGEYVERVN